MTKEDIDASAPTQSMTDQRDSNRQVGANPDFITIRKTDLYDAVRDELDDAFGDSRVTGFFLSEIAADGIAAAIVHRAKMKQADDRLESR